MYVLPKYISMYIHTDTSHSTVNLTRNLNPHIYKFSLLLNPNFTEKVIYQRFTRHHQHYCLAVNEAFKIGINLNICLLTYPWISQHEVVSSRQAYIRYQADASRHLPLFEHEILLTRTIFLHNQCLVTT